MTRRTDRVAGLLRQEISQLLRERLKDPRLRALVSVTHVEPSADLQYASVAISVLGNPEQQQEALEGMESSAGFLHRELRNRLHIRPVPRLRFVLDTSLQEGDRIQAIMDRIQSEEVERHG
jgi:ribosome-binding factor A